MKTKGRERGCHVGRKLNLKQKLKLRLNQSEFGAAGPNVSFFREKPHGFVIQNPTRHI